MFSNIIRTVVLLSRSDRKKGILLLILMGCQAALEVGVLGMIMPFLAMVADSSQIMNYRFLTMLYEASGVFSTSAFLIVMGFTIIGLIIFKNIFQTLLLIAQAKFTVKVQLGVERELMSSYLRQNYLFHVERNPSELYQNMRSVSAVMGLILTPLLQGLTEITILIFMLAFLFWLHPFVTLGALFLFGGGMFLTYLSIGHKVRRVGEIAQIQATAMDQWMIQSFAGIKEIKILGREDFFLQKTLNHSLQFVSATFRGQIFQQLTRPIIETVGFSIIMLSIIANLAFGSPDSSIMPTLVLFVAAAFRLMPGLNRIITSALTIRQGTSRIDSVTRELSNSSTVELKAKIDSDKNQLKLSHKIELENIVYCYPSTIKPSLKGLSLSVIKGQSIALVGPSGAGKTTIVDLILGLLPDYMGTIAADGTELRACDMPTWRRNFGYIPQAIYLSDDTMRRNIAFGLADDEIDDEKVVAALKIAQLEDLVKSLPDGLNTMVGDRGARLSGGQKQRIGIARALYSDPEILILDEATSALDNETEQAVSSAIARLSGSKTIILIAHRLSTVIHCDKIFFVQDGKVDASGTFSELLEMSPKFRNFAKPE